MKDHLHLQHPRSEYNIAQPSSRFQQAAFTAEFPPLRKSPPDSKSSPLGTKITTALLLAAGTGTRLQPLTSAAPKCLTEINGVSILERLIGNLRSQGFKRLIVVIGHLGDQIQQALQRYAGDMQIDYIINPVYRTTNNLYSLWLAREQISEPFLLVESDLVFDTSLLDHMIYPDRMAVSKMLPWMNGTTVELSSSQEVTAFRMGNASSHQAPQYKTVNIYSLSLLSWEKIEACLSRYVSDEKLGDYYEIAFAELIADRTLSFEAVFFEADLWYEIDTAEDLLAAEILFASSHSISHRSTSDAASAALLPG
ncbi:MAG: phosphocholine cytidylyltransferase family protein [Verrucomicrobiales bacterium]|nr:phosphocholine cytidylyltransferase family protein [Verrucomicrobiales bacterium]